MSTGHWRHSKHWMGHWVKHSTHWKVLLHRRLFSKEVCDVKCPDSWWLIGAWMATRWMASLQLKATGVVFYVTYICWHYRQLMLRIASINKGGNATANGNIMKALRWVLTLWNWNELQLWKGARTVNWISVGLVVVIFNWLKLSETLNCNNWQLQRIRAVKMSWPFPSNFVGNFIYSGDHIRI